METLTPLLVLENKDFHDDNRKLLERERSRQLY